MASKVFHAHYALCTKDNLQNVADKLQFPFVILFFLFNNNKFLIFAYTTNFLSRVFVNNIVYDNPYFTIHYGLY